MQFKTTFPLLFLLLSATVLSAQWSKNVVTETEKMMSFGSRPCFRVDFPGADAGTVEDLWKDFAKKNYGAKLKKDKKSGEWSASELKSSMMGSDPFTLYSTIEKTSNGATLNVWYDAGNYFLNRRDNAGRSDEAVRALRQLYLDVRRATINSEIKDQENKLKDMEKKYKTMQKTNDGLVKDIENYKARIKKAEEDIAKNEKEQETNLIDQETQRRLIEESRQRLNNVENEGN
ncbi:MAG: hypothetical protein IPJ82_23735 [Lewinellaceae bacterium]|nr:hypothetical protein [Lewinellaceae bacterium]